MNRTILALAAEAAFNTETPAASDQFPFTRLRLRMDVPAAGIYTVTHPYGESPPAARWTSSPPRRRPPRSPSAAARASRTVVIPVLGNDADVDGPAPLSVANLTQPVAGRGTVALAANQTVAYTAPAAFSGSATFTYQARDAAGALSGVATVTVTVTSPPVDLDISRFNATARVRLGRGTVALSVGIANGGTVNQARTATVTGVLNGAQVYQRSLAVSDAPGGGVTTFNSPAYTPTAVGTITWTAQVLDDVPAPPDQSDTATATSQIVP
jgi:hypothetical protein